ncbi:MAG: 3-deoxy-7-phosphoheptulonate synthase class II [Actinomycetia bacterium]|nr:3-deoxy-7-phosphoheptulonate synthase class II [Actinomycetes bacterium]
MDEAISPGVPPLEALRALPQHQQPTYPDPAAEAAVVARLRALPPLVFAGECDDLRADLAEVGAGRAFILQGGDCAETFDGVTANSIKARMRVLLSMAVVLGYAGQTPVVTLGRIAGQYAKPRSNDTETREGVTLPAYRGDAVNGFDFTKEARTPDPERLVRMYNASASTLNLARAFMAGGFGDVRQSHSWNAHFVRDEHVSERFEALAAEIQRAIGFMEACGLRESSLRVGGFYATHEALLLAYEHSMTRIDYRSGQPYDTSGHLVWIGERTRQLDGAHVELLRHVRNPLGVKLGPSTSPADAVALAERLDPDQEPGRLTLITRLGAAKVRDLLPPLVEAIEATGRRVAWVCDPMHGNTVSTATGFKTRRYADVMGELDGFFDVHEALGTWPGGVHVELTGDDVTECVGGSFDIGEDDLASHYESLCDPRLSRNQALELAFLVAERLSPIAARRAAPTEAEEWDH